MTYSINKWEFSIILTVIDSAFFHLFLYLTIKDGKDLPFIEILKRLKWKVHLCHRDTIHAKGRYQTTEQPSMNLHSLTICCNKFYILSSVYYGNISSWRNCATQKTKRLQTMVYV